MSNIALSFKKDVSDGLTHNVRRGRKGTQNGIGRILGYQSLFLGRLPGDHFNSSSDLRVIGTKAQRVDSYLLHLTMHT